MENKSGLVYIYTDGCFCRNEMICSWENDLTPTHRKRDKGMSPCTLQFSSVILKSGPRNRRGDENEIQPAFLVHQAKSKSKVANNRRKNTNVAGLDTLPTWRPPWKRIHTAQGNRKNTANCDWSKAPPGWMAFNRIHSGPAKTVSSIVFWTSQDQRWDHPHERRAWRGDCVNDAAALAWWMGTVHKRISSPRL